MGVALEFAFTSANHKRPLAEISIAISEIYTTIKRPLINNRSVVDSFQVHLAAALVLT